MAVQPDRTQRSMLDSGALDALAEAGRAAARAPRLTEILQPIVEGAARATGADVVLARVLDRRSGELVVRAVAAATDALAVELDGARVAAHDIGGAEVELDAAPEPVRALAERLGAEAALVVPVLLGDELAGTLELLRRRGGFDRASRAAARLAAAQAALAIRVGEAAAGVPEDVAERALRVAGDALAAGADASRAANHVLRLALEISGASAALLWRPEGDGGVVLGAAIGPAGEAVAGEGAPAAVRALGLAQPRVERTARRALTTLRLGEPPIGLLQLAFVPERAPSEREVERLAVFAARAAHALRAGERARALGDELEQTRALLALVGRANEELSLAHTLEIAVEQVAKLLEAEQLGVYLRDGDRLLAAAGLALAGPHAPVAEALLELALGPFRGRGIVALPDLAAEPRLAHVSDAVAEAGLEAVVAVPLIAADQSIGLLAVYPERGHVLSESERTLLGALAGRLAVAVQNARLHEQATRLGAELEQALAAERGAARRLGALYEISRSFAQSLSLDVTLEALARTVVELLDVDAAVLRMPDPRREQLLPLALHVADERLEPSLRSILFRPQPFTGVHRTLFTDAQPLVLDAETAASLGRSHTLLVPFLQKGSTASVVPIATPAEVLASLTLVSLRPDRPIGPETVEAAVAIGAQAALAIDNARLYQQQKDFADAMQRSLLPKVRPPGLDLGAVYASSARGELGGDLYDWLALESESVAVVLGDVTGHGIDAAADMAMAKYVFRSLAREHPEPSEFLAAANDVVVDEIGLGKFITMVYLLLEPASGEVSCACAGHPPPRLVRADGSVRGLDAGGLALGIEAGAEYEAVHAELELGGCLVVYTDGVIEARRDGKLYGTERLDALLARRHSRRARDIAGSVVESARQFTGGDLLDDCAVVVLKRLGE